MQPCDLPAVEARRLIAAKSLSASELLESCIQQIEAIDPAVNAMVARDFDRARGAAKAADAATIRGDKLPPLHGLPIGIKDLLMTEGLASTMGSLLLEKNIPARDDHLVARLRRMGAIVVGKTNTPEFGAGANTRNAVYGATGNPFDPTKSCAGSSGGSAVALATNMVPLSARAPTPEDRCAIPPLFVASSASAPRRAWCPPAPAPSGGAACPCWARWRAPSPTPRCCCPPWPATMPMTRWPPRSMAKRSGGRRTFTRKRPSTCPACAWP
jgi:hypothetical protein